MSKLIWNDRTIGQILENNVDVPDYQREYAWTIEEVKDFFDDLTLFIESDEEDYLFGQMIMHNDGSTLHIVDGQQRLSTSVIFIKVLIDITNNLSKTDPSNDNLNKLKVKMPDDIGNDSDDDGPFVYRFSMGTQNRLFFNEYVLNGNHEFKKRDKGNKRIKDAYDTLKSEIMKKLESCPDNDSKAKLLSTYRSSFLKGFHVSYVESTDLGQAYVVFETLNSRGRQLEAKDLLKNFFFRRSINTENTKERWNEMSKELNEEGVDISKFIRYFWNASHPFARTRTLFREVSTQFKNDTAEINAFLDELFRAYPVYLDIVSCRKSEFLSPRSVELLSNIKPTGATSFHPILLSLYDRFVSSKPNTVKQKDVENILKSIECLIVRNQIVMGYVANSNEVDFSDIAREIFDGCEIDSAIKRITNLTATDQDIESRFKTYSPKEDRAKYILRALYDDEHQEIEISKNNKKVHLEHIMPVVIGEWDVDESTHREYHKRIGNMTLLHHKINESIQNSQFEVKREEYLKSDFPDTKEIGEKTKWTTQDIEERQEHLKERVLARWSLIA